MMGLFWKKDKDLLAVEIQSEIKKLTKQNSSTETGINVRPLGIISPTTIIRKIIYRECCDLKFHGTKLC